MATILFFFFSPAGFAAASFPTPAFKSPPRRHRQAGGRAALVGRAGAGSAAAPRKKVKGAATAERRALDVAIPNAALVASLAEDVGRTTTKGEGAALH